MKGVFGRNMSLEQYMRDIEKFPPLRREEENELALAAQEGDEYSREKLVNHNLKYCANKARSFVRINNMSYNELEEFMAAANEGLVESINRFNPKKGSFKACASWAIFGQLIDCLRDNKFIHIPGNKYEDLRNFYQVIENYNEAGHEDPSDRKIAEELSYQQDKSYSAAYVRDLRFLINDGNVDSLNRKIGEEGVTELGDLIETTEAMESENVVNRKETYELVKHNISLLNTDSTTKQILYHHLFSYMSKEELRAEYDLGAKKFRDLYNKGLRLLKRNLKQQSDLYN